MNNAFSLDFYFNGMFDFIKGCHLSLMINGRESFKNKILYEMSKMVDNLYDF